MNDGLLAHHIAVSEKIGYSDALNKIKEQVIQWKENLSKNQAIQLEGIGKFFNDQAGNLQFQYETDLNFLTASYGLNTFQSLPVDRSKKLKVAYKAEETEEEKIKVLPVINRMAKYSVAAALLSVAMLTAYKMQWASDINLEESSMNPFKTEKSVYESVKYGDFTMNDEKESSLRKEIANSDESWIYYDAEIEGLDKKMKVILKEDKKIPISTKVEKKSVAPTINYGKYHVVGGCFGVENNAKKMVRKLQRSGYQADMSVSHKGLHVVSYQSFKSESDALSFLKEVKRDHNSQAWLLVK